jgi:hypothetical protein
MPTRHKAIEELVYFVKQLMKAVFEWFELMGGEQGNWREPSAHSRRRPRASGP